MVKPVVPTHGPPPIAVGETELNAMIAKGRSDPTAIRTLRCRTVARGRLHQLNYIRDLPAQPVMEDEPQGLSGESVAPNASEALLAALGSCLAVGIHANALAQGILIRVLELELSADINTTSAWGRATPRRRRSGSKRSACRFGWRRTHLVRHLRYSSGMRRCGRRSRTRSITPSTWT